ncbi:MAG TPA: NEW3 domain-containing protein, partial [Nakamurella sp.]|nr:NEW3 domain-containing protein [Nakamurella sp.]
MSSAGGTNRSGTATDAGNPYGNPFNDYLRRPYGVMSSPQQQADLPPVQDDPAEPFDWYRYPRAAIGVYGGPEESIVTAEGYLKTIFGTLTFATGADHTPVDQRVKTWADGYLPILQYDFERAGVANHVEMFAATVPGVATIPYTERFGVPSQTLTADVDNMINFVRVTFTNTTTSPLTYTFSASLGTDRVTQPNGNLAGRTWTPGPARPSTISYDATTKSFGGDGKLLYTVSADPDAVGPDGASPAADWNLALQPGQSRSLVFKMPYYVAQSSDTAAIGQADYDTERSATSDFWHRTLDNAGTTIDVPGDGVERKVVDTYKASLALSLIDVDLIDGQCFWDANPTVYDNYYLRDAAFDLDGLLNAGFTDLVKSCTRAMLPWQNADGEFQSQNNEWDGNGEALWMMGDYITRTHDTAFAQEVYPAVQRAMAWEWQFRQAAWPQAHGLFPALSMRDNEHVTGHVLTYDLWAIAGERGAAAVAAAAGDADTAAAWTDRADQYVQILRTALQPAVSELGWIPPTTEGMQAAGTGTGWYGTAYGIDWGNLEAVWPSGVFAPDDPWITASLKAWRSKMFEGIFTYPNGGVESTLHSYTPISISVTDIRAGDQTAAVQSLYDLLVHTSATDTTTEGMNAAQRWGWNDSNRTQPHGEFAGKYLTLLHDMLAFSGQDGSLHLANTWSPVWAQPGQHVGFSGDTDFGHVSYRIDVRDDGMTMHLSPPTRNAPKTIVVSVPSSVTVTDVQVSGGAPATVAGDRITLPAPTSDTTITVTWNRGTGPDLSFARAVQDYRANYAAMTSAPEVSVTGLQTSAPTVRIGEPLTVGATVVNTGGAGYLADPDVTLYVDGQPAQTDTRTFARGIGFSTPDSVISFARNTEGVIPVRFTVRLCDTGTHTVAIGLGDTPPADSSHVQLRPQPASAPAPGVSVRLAAQPQYLDAGAAGTLDATVTNTGCEPVTDTQVSLRAPDGWQLTPTTGTQLGTIQPGDSARVSWSYPAAVGDPSQAVTPATMQAEASYGWRGISTGSAEGDTTVYVLQPVQAPYRTHTDTFAAFGQSGDSFAIAAGGRDMGGSYDEFGAIYTAGTATPSTVATT